MPRVKRRRWATLTILGTWPARRITDRQGTPIERDQILDYINRDRARHGGPPLRDERWIAEWARADRWSTFR